MDKISYVYIMSNPGRSTLYVGVTNDLERRIFEHKCGQGSKFCRKYHLVDLLYFEEYDRFIDAIEREKQLKSWHRAWKLNLIRKDNPELKDLSAEWFDENTKSLIDACKKHIDIFDF